MDGPLQWPLMSETSAPPCPRCGGSGMIHVEADTMVPCRCEAGDRVKERIQADILKEADKLDD